MKRRTAMKRTVAVVLGALAVNVAPALAKDNEAGTKGVAVGEKVNCLDIVRIRNTRVLDDKTILFYMRGNEVYKNTLPTACPQLGFEKTFTYSTSLTQLCHTDIITVLFATPLQEGASCGLGLFEKIDPTSLKPEDGAAAPDAETEE